MKTTKKAGVVQLVSPWVEYYRKIQAMFHEDEDVTVLFDEQNIKIKIYVDASDKAVAIQALLPTEKVFGNITLTIDVIPSNTANVDMPETNWELYLDAFEDNPAVENIKRVDDPSLNNPMTFVVFKATVVQYFNDNLASLNGLTSCLYEDLASELFIKKDGVFFSTAKLPDKKSSNYDDDYDAFDW